jgi:hypothetical protein
MNEWPVHNYDDDDDDVYDDDDYDYSIQLLLMISMHSVCCPVEATESAGTMARQAYQREQHTDGP